jgi:hypothetical protein
VNKPLRFRESNRLVGGTITMDEIRSNRDPIAVLADRLVLLERSNRRLRTATSVLVLFTAATVTVGAAALVPDTIAAKSFRLVDAAGAERAALTTGDHGTAVLTLLTGKGDSAMTMTFAPSTPFVVVADAQGKPFSPPASKISPQPADQEKKKGGLFGWGKPPLAGGEEEDDSFDWAD